MTKPAPKVATGTFDATMECLRAPPGAGLTKASLLAAPLLERLAPRCDDPRDLLALIGELLDVAEYLRAHAKARKAADTLTHEVIAVLAERLAVRTDASLPRELATRIRDSVRESKTTMPKPKGSAGISMRAKRR